jgi:hypothetical protein
MQQKKTRILTKKIKMEEILIENVCGSREVVGS